MTRLPRRARFLVMMLPWLFLTPTAHAQLGQFVPPPKDVVKAKAVWTRGGKVRPGDEAALAVVLDIAPHYHINPAGEPREPNLIATALTVTETPQGLKAGPLQFPEPMTVDVRFGGTPRKIEAYQGRVIFYVPATIASDAALGPHTVKLRLRYQACNETNCLFPVNLDIATGVEVTREATPPSPEEVELFRGFHRDAPARAAPVSLDFFGWRISVGVETSWGIAGLLVLAGIGGLLLNFTPCVLPVIPIKMMSLSRAATSRSHTLLLGAVMSAGVVLFWLVLGGMVATTVAAVHRAGGERPDWGGLTSTNELFQHPWFTISIGIVIALMAVGMCGLFSLRLPQFVYAITPKQESVSGSLLFGVMTAVLSTPCTAPLMGGAAAWATKQSPRIALLVFAAIGIGMALPYLALSAFPALVNRMPRTGPASELIKQTMGLLMLAAGLFFIGSGLSSYLVTPPDPPSLFYWWLVAAPVVLAGLWLAYRTVRITHKVALRVVFVMLGVLLMSGGAYGAVQLSQHGPIAWTYYTPERFAEAQRAGKVIVLDFTAEWCINCKVLEGAVLHRAEVVKALAGPTVQPIKVDLTGNNVMGNQKLGEVGRVTIPTLVIYAPDGRQTLNSDAYTADQVLRAIAEARVP